MVPWCLCVGVHVGVHAGVHVHAGLHVLTQELHLHPQTICSDSSKRSPEADGMWTVGLISLEGKAFARSATGFDQNTVGCPSLFSTSFTAGGRGPPRSCPHWGQSLLTYLRNLVASLLTCSPLYLDLLPLCLFSQLPRRVKIYTEVLVLVFPKN